MRALKNPALALAFALASPNTAAAQEGLSAGAAAGALAGGLLGGPIGAVFGGMAGAAVGGAVEGETARPQAGVRRPWNGQGVVERTCVRDRHGNRTCREVVR